MIIFSALFLKEKADNVQKLSVVAAFIGSLFIIKPGLRIEQIVPVAGRFCGSDGGRQRLYLCARFKSARRARTADRLLLFRFFLSGDAALSVIQLWRR